ncbi:MAG: (Fe-S)-binding protein [Deltaproteobacteria bacterium]|nr:(Fe-S)-binding protein [Deltaproteobacteria bacterium]MBW2049199.1 (Fe-S)-binding protein [Deltaproteobacteria bacterium]MBW2112544.1 (Fe-S)-binding protein [Deltaproteobacteria bacterium]MBW2353896.1 (Fe-S)-binding protein [Deltaproteobacteria bacterium]
MDDRYGFEKKFRDQILRCSSCGFCRAVCPVLGLTKRPALNARGKMLILQEVMAGNADLNHELVETLFQCTTCGSCSAQCPSGVDPPEIIKEVRKDMVHLGTCHPAFEGMNRILGEHTNIYGEDEPEDFERERNRKARYVFFIGCVGSYREDEATAATLNILDHLKVDYTLIDEVCCSGVLEDVGYEINEDLARKNVELILATGAGTVITGCPYCSRTFNNKGQYRPLRDAGLEIIHISQFLKDFDIGVKTDRVVTYHDPCDLGRHCGIYEEPREVIRKCAPNFVEMRHSRADALCCGAGGGVRGAFAKNSIAMARRRLEEVEETGASVVLTECNSCVHNLNNAKLRAQKFKIFTTTQFLNQLLEGAG